LRPWTKRFPMIIFARWLHTCSKLTEKKSKNQPGNLEI